MKSINQIFLTAAIAVAGISTAAAQDVTMPVNKETSLIEYAETVNMSGVKKDELYKRGTTWFNKYYTNPASVIKKQSPEDGEITGIHTLKIYNTDKEGKKMQSGEIGYTVSLLFKDDRYRIVVTKFNQKGVSYKPIEPWMDKNSKGYNVNYANYLNQTDAFTKELIASIKKGMNETGVKAKTDW